MIHKLLRFLFVSIVMKNLLIMNINMINVKCNNFLEVPNKTLFYQLLNHAKMRQENGFVLLFAVPSCKLSNIT